MKWVDSTADRRGNHLDRDLTLPGIIGGLLTLHYGIGFILGTGERVYLTGASGAVYALSTGLGLLCFAFLAGFYWRARYLIWHLLGNQYGSRVRTTTNALSWVWMAGVTAAQILGGASALRVLGAPANLAMMIVAFAIAGFAAVFDVMENPKAILTRTASRTTGVLGDRPERIKKIREWMLASILMMSTGALMFATWRLGGASLYLKSVQDFVPSLSQAPLGDVLGVGFATVLLTVIGMDFQQYVVRGRSQADAVWASVIAGICLIPMAFLPAAVALAAKASLSNSVMDAKEAIPLVISVLGDRLSYGGGTILVGALSVAAVGSGMGLVRAMNASLRDAVHTDGRLARHTASFVNVVVAFGIALLGETIVRTIVSFYAIYVAGVFVPFMAYLLDRTDRLHFSSRSIQASMWTGALVAAVIFAASIIDERHGSVISAGIHDWREFLMIIGGMLGAVLVLLVTHQRSAFFRAR